jgi:hypothetical protein
VTIAIIIAVINGGEIIESEHITNWGRWGIMTRCPNGTFVKGFRLRTEPYRGALVDDTASNAVKFYCGDPGKKKFVPVPVPFSNSYAI